MWYQTLITLLWAYQYNENFFFQVLNSWRNFSTKNFPFIMIEIFGETFFLLHRMMIFHPMYTFSFNIKAFNQCLFFVYLIAHKPLPISYFHFNHLIQHAYQKKTFPQRTFQSQRRNAWNFIVIKLLLSCMMRFREMPKVNDWGGVNIDQ